MGTDTKLILSKRWELDDIKIVIENYLIKTKVKVIDCNTTSIGLFRFGFKIDKEERMMYVHSDYPTPLGTATLISLGHNEQAIKIMKTIAEVLGGFLLESDCEGNHKSIQGMFSEGNGLSYFFKYAVLHNELKDENDLVGLNKSIHKWHKTTSDTDISRMRLFKE